MTLRDQRVWANWLKSERLSDRFTLAVLALSWVYVAAIVIWIALRLTVGEDSSVVRVLNALQPWIAIACLPGVIALAFRRHWWSAGAQALVAVLVFAPYFHFLVHFRAGDESSPAYTVMSYNTYARNTSPDAVAQVVRDVRPDIAFLQEVAEPDKVLRALEGLYSGADMHFSVDLHLGLIVISRFPVTELPSLGHCQKVLLHVPGGDIRGWNFHAPKTVSGTKDQYRFVRSLAEDVNADDGRVLVVGDLNATDQNASYQYLNAELRNAFWEVGFGLGNTFPAAGRRIAFLPAMIRIDHIFYAGDMRAERAWVGSRSGGSDHYPVIARFSSISAQ